MLRWIAHTLIGIGTLGWVVVIFALGGDPNKQMLAAGIITVGIFLHHLWDEVYRNKDA